MERVNSYSKAHQHLFRFETAHPPGRMYGEGVAPLATHVQQGKWEKCYLACGMMMAENCIECLVLVLLINKIYLKCVTFCDTFITGRGLCAFVI
jgi:hypothetical protein